jgi:excisionase family DNA binding protein
MPEPLTAAPVNDYWTAEQLAEMLQVSVKSVFRWATEDASMPVLRIGRTVRFPKARLLRWLAAREQGVGRPRRSQRPLSSATQNRAESTVGGAGPSV